jgi:CheY-like chemotaxis protein
MVEDEGAVLIAAVRILNSDGYKVLSRSDPTHALDVLADVATDLSILVTDVVMPRMSGVDLARRAQELRPGLPVLFLSGYSQDTSTGLASLPPGSAVLPKPFTRRSLLDAISALLTTVAR